MKHVMEPSEHDNILLRKIPYFVGGTGLMAEWKRWGLHNRSDSGRSARVALCAHPTFTHTQPPSVCCSLRVMSWITRLT
jgi:hypothetical protein